jgi:hypothetical protein
VFYNNEHNSSTNLPSPQTFRSYEYLHNQYGPGIYPNFRKLERLKIQLAKTSNHLTFLMKCKTHDIVPKGLLLKAPYHSHHSSKITLRARKALLRDRIELHHFKKAAFNKQINDLESFFRRSINQPDHLHIMAAVESSFKLHFLKQRRSRYENSQF